MLGWQRVAIVTGLAFALFQTTMFPFYFSLLAVLARPAESFSKKLTGRVVANGTASSPNITTSSPAINGSQCQSSLVSWSSEYSENLIPYTWRNSSTYTTEHTSVYAEGVADVYTTDSDVPRAHGTLTTTANVTWSTTQTVLVVQTNYWTVAPTFTLPSPSCTIGYDDCSALYSNYRSSLGLPWTASLPSITPAPTNSPKCFDQVGDYLSSSFTYDGSCWVGFEPAPCDVVGTSVTLFYWPTTQESYGSTDNCSTSSTHPVTAKYGNLTFTSPSVYVSIPAVAMTTYIYDLEFCGNFAEGGAAISEMPPLYNVVATISPEELSSAVHSLPGLDPASVAYDIALGRSDYRSLAAAVYGSQNYTYRPVDYNAIASPPPEAYYLGLKSPPGCDIDGPHPECSTIFDGAYAVGLKIPKQLRTLAPAWATCVDDSIHGLYATAIALQPDSSGAVALTSTQPATSTVPASPSSTPAAPTPTSTV